MRSGLSALMFLAVASTIWGSFHLYVGRRLLGTWEPAPRVRRLGWAVLGAHFFIAPLTFSLLRRSGGGLADGVQWFGYLSMGVFSLVMGLLLFKDLAWLGLLGLDRLLARAGAPPPDPARRRLLQNTLHAGVLGLSGALAAAGYSQARRLAEVERVALPVPGLAPGLQGLRIAQISDVHVGPTIRRDTVQAIVDRVNSLQPDLIAVTGDLVDGEVPSLAEHVAPLAGLRAPLGVFFVTGNHEYYSGVGPWLEHLRGLGWRVLLDEHLLLPVRGAALLVAGVSDLSAARFEPEHLSDPELALAGAPPADFRLLLAHQPRSAFAAAQAGFDLMLSGHTHGGQYFPYTWLIRLAQPFTAGLHRLERLWVYVNRGTTYWGPPIRLGSPQEITLVELVAG